MAVDDTPEDDGPGAPRKCYNFAPGYRGLVYRADTTGSGTGPRSGYGDSGEVRATVDDDAAVRETEAKDKSQADESAETRYKLQCMKWGLIPSWTRRDPGWAGVAKTINCRSDALAAGGGLWASMKAGKRCVVVAQGFYEWLKPVGRGSKVKKPHYIKRADGKLMYFAGLWDCAWYGDEDEARWTYTIITTDSNKQLEFLHDRMPAILEAASEDMNTWLDPGRYEWCGGLQAVLRPYEGILEVYPVSGEVGKVGNDDASFVLPVDSRENKKNIANFFSVAKGRSENGRGGKVRPEIHVKREEEEEEEVAELPEAGATGKRRASPDEEADAQPQRKTIRATSIDKEKDRPRISATSNAAKSLGKAKDRAEKSGKITKFFANTARSDEDGKVDKPQGRGGPR